ncbi:probable G-protein coupled receptor 139 [Rhincodon typus]|uniref:probable G-protein coupled receptor 139 n=1 Tax=Rhincodon typus TaxID=259920 RepID=UPI00202EAB97|nr:probable G-protein coupled receptor 139 [Rhincodon typus]
MHGIPRGLVFAIYYPVLAAIGLPANLALIIILYQRRCGLSGCITYYLVSMAITDLMLIVTAVILNRIAGIFFPFSFPFITPVCSLRLAFNFAAIDSSAWLTVAFTFDRFVVICCQKLKTKYCTEKVAVRVIGIVSALTCLKNAFVYFIYEPTYIVNNIPLFCRARLIFYTSPAWAAYDWIRPILTPCLPFILILLLNILTVRYILVANRGRRRLRVQNNGKNQGDPEMEKRRKSIVLLFAISGTFILLHLLFIITIIYIRVAKVVYFTGSDFSEQTFLLEEAGFRLLLLTSSVNPFIYAGTQGKIRIELRNGLKYPLRLLIQIFKIGR